MDSFQNSKKILESLSSLTSSSGMNSDNALDLYVFDSTASLVSPPSAPPLIRSPDHYLQSIPTHRSDPDCVMASEPTLSSLAQLASNAEDAFDFSQNQDPSSSTGKTKEQIRKHYLRTLHKVIDQSDIIILVLDARDPEGCRSRLVEEEVRRRETEGKKLVFVLNKVGE